MDSIRFLRPSRRALLLSLGALATGLAPVAHAAEYPDRPIRVIVPYAPGGATDVVARLMSQKLG
ncbi:MAG: tripartite tricarboxylate transporter substrate binding protein, partial [Burkholderiaceae bacterium]|nr:tripartite tricarboxylate transporter substrate binding protein [Burkholderiaceae bacterium]